MTKRGKGVKILAIVERYGLPLSVRTHAANYQEATLVQLIGDFYMLEWKPEELIGNGAYDSDVLDENLRAQGIEMIRPHRVNRQRRRTQCWAETVLVSMMVAGRAVLSVNSNGKPPFV